MFIIRNNKLIYLSRMQSCLWGWSCYHYSLAQGPISHRIHIFLSSLSMMQVRNACPYGVRVGVVFHSGRARPTEVFKLVLSLGAQITRTDFRTFTVLFIRQKYMSLIKI